MWYGEPGWEQKLQAWRRVLTRRKVIVLKRKVGIFGSGIPTPGLRSASQARTSHTTFDAWPRLAKGGPGKYVVLFNLGLCVRHMAYRSSLST